jgi:hypothetical protein
MVPYQILHTLAEQQQQEWWRQAAEDRRAAARPSQEHAVPARQRRSRRPFAFAPRRGATEPQACKCV